jgi:hypothetical protein
MYFKLESDVRLLYEIDHIYSLHFNSYLFLLVLYFL